MIKTLIRCTKCTIWMSLGLFISLTASGVESPPNGSPFAIQTNSANAPAGQGDYYSSNSADPGFHYFSIHVPSAWPSTEPVHIDIFSPELNTNDVQDEDNGDPFGDSQFELYDAGTVVTSPDIPGAGAAGTLGAVTFPPSSDPVQWRRTFTLPAPVAPGRYIMRVQSDPLSNDQNGYRIRVGTDDDNDPTNPPPSNTDNPDGIAGTGDEVILGTFQVTYQQDSGGLQCLTLYEYVPDGLVNLTFNNFDMDGNTRVCYYAPSDVFDPLATSCGAAANSGTTGTLSGNNAWNNGGDDINRGGDVIVNPETGWWAIVSCISSNNQFIQEGPLNTPAFDFLPPVPILDLDKDDNVDEASPGQVIDYTLSFTNTSNAASTAPSAAAGLVITDPIPGGMSFVGCAINAPLTGSCSESSGTVTFNIDQTVPAGGSGSVTLSLRVENNATYPIQNTARIDYTDPWSIGSFFDTAIENTPERIGLNVAKSANPTSGSVGDSVTYDYLISNTAGSFIELDSVVDDKIGPIPFNENQGMATLRYDFNADASPGTVEDTSGVAALLDLTVEDVANVSYPDPPGSFLSINSATRLSNATDSNKVFGQCTTNDEITVEVWVRTGASTQGGPARIITQSQDENNRNFTLAQNGSAYQFRLRTTANGLNGDNTVLESAQNSTDVAIDQHVVATRDAAGTAVLYLNGLVVDTETIAGDFSNWDATYDLGMGNEFGVISTDTTRDWQGRIYETSIYCNALTANQVGARFAFGSEENVDNRTILAPSQNLNLSASYTITAGDFPGPVINVVQVNGTDQNGDNFFDEDTASVAIVPSDLTLTKTASATGPLNPGDLNTYTLTLTNNSLTTQTGILVTDALPAGLNYVAESTVATGFGSASNSTYRDNFGAVSYANNDGTANFANNWDEGGTETDDSPTTGDIQIIGGQLRLNPASTADFATIQREFDLSGVSNATLTFDWSVSGDTEACDGGGAQDCTDLHIDIGAIDFNDTNLADGTGRLVRFSDNNPTNVAAGGTCSDSGNQGTCSFPLDSQLFASSNVRVGLGSTGYIGGDEFIEIDNLQISFTIQSPLVLDNDPNTATAALDNGTAPFLVTTNDGFVLGPGQSMTVTFVAQVDPNLDPNITVLRNLASADSDQTFPTVAERLDAVSPRGSIGDLVWLDADGDGFFDVGEPGLANVTVRLIDQGTSTVVETTTTGADGRYLFDRLSMGNYRVEIDIPTGLSLSPGQTNPSAIVNITGSEQVRDIDFGLAGNGIVGDTVFSDADGDGVQDPGELGIGGVTVELRDANTGAVVGTATTAADGSYRFNGVAAGTYVVAVTDTGNVLNGFSLTTGSAITDPISLAAGDVFLGADFGYQNSSLADLRDRVWFDVNNNGLLDGSETGIANVTVDLLDSSGNVVATTTTNRSGNFEFRDLPNGDYTIRVSDSLGILTSHTATTGPASNEQLAVTMAGSDINGTSFGYSLPGFIGDTVFSDSDGDGVQDNGEPGISGVSVLLYRDSDGDGVLNTAVDELLSTTTTDAAGNYGFIAPRFGTYFVSIDDTQAALSGFSPTTTDEEPGGAAAGTQIEVALGGSNGGFLDADFGYQNAALPDVSGNVFNDLDRDGIDDGDTEPGIGQVLVELVDAGPDGVFGTSDDLIVATDLTDSSGDYEFTDVQAGNYRVRIADDLGILTDYSITSGLDSLPVTVAAADITGIDFGYAQEPAAASIGDFVWLDADGDGFADASEPGLPGVTVRLFDVGPDGVIGGGDDVLIAVTETDALGGYRFNDLDAGNYYVMADTSTVTSGLQLTAGSNPTSVIALARGQRFNDADFGFGAAPGTAVLGDLVWSDTNGNGQPDAGEPGLSGVTINLVSTGPDGQNGTADDISLTAVTDANGRYLFSGLIPDIDYSVTVDDTTVPGTHNAVPTNTSGGNLTYLVDPPAGNAVLSLDYGFQPQAGATGSIGDRVFLDADGDGTQNAGEPGIENVSLDLVDPGPDGVLGTADDVIIATTFTDANGDYLFSGVSPGTYAVVVTDTAGVLAGLNQSTPAPALINLAGGANVSNIDFGFAPSTGLGSIGNQVFHDVNGNGQRDTGESGIQGVELELWEDINGNGQIDPGIDNLLRTTVTDENGGYEFTGLADGDYIVNVAAGNFQANQVLEGTSSTAVANPPATDNTAQTNPLAITLGSGTTEVIFADFGFDAGVERSLSGTTFEDINQDPGDRGALEAGEPDVANVALVLYRDLDGDGVVDPGDPVWGRTVSAADGSYQFTSLPPGNYIVQADASNTRVNGFEQTTQQGGGFPQVGVQPVDLTTSNSTGNNFGFYNGGVATTPVSLAYFRAVNNGSGTRFEWGTAIEAGNAGFRIMGSDSEFGDKFELIGFIPSSAVDSVTPLDYVAQSTQGATYYWIADIDLFNRETLHGPFLGDGSMYGSQINSRAINWQQIRAARPAANRSLPDQIDAVALSVPVTGIYRVTYEDLVSAGFDLVGVPASDVALVDANGATVARYIDTEIVGPGSFIEFYGTALNTLYTQTNVYTLSVDASLALAAGMDQGISDVVDVNARERRVERFERQDLYSFSSVTDDPWYDERLLAFGQPRTYPVPMTTSQAVSESASLRVSMQGGADFPTGLPDHHVILEWNGNVVDDFTDDGLVLMNRQLNVPLSQSGANELLIRVPGDTGNRFDLVNFDWAEIEYRRALQATSDHYAFQAETRPASVDPTDTDQVFGSGFENVPGRLGFRVTGFSSDDVSVYATGGSQLIRVQPSQIVDTGNGFDVVVPARNGSQQYVMTTVAAALRPEIQVLGEMPDLLSQPADYLMISHADFIPGIQRLVDFHEAAGRQVQVVDVEDIYSRYSGGVFDPEAIRTFLQEAALVKDLTHVLLVGADSYDYQDYLGIGSISFIPTFYRQTNEIVSFTPTDTPFADLDNDLAPDLAIGRFPVRTVQELDWLIDKTIAYANRDYHETSVFIADRSAPGSAFSASSEDLIERLPEQWQRQQLYLDDLENPETVRQGIVSAVNNGISLTTYFGHSAPTQWSFENVFSTADVGLFSNVGQPTAVNQWGCWNTYFVSPLADTLGHQLLLSGPNGAAVVFGPAALTEQTSEQVLGNLSMGTLTVPGLTVGEALLTAKQEMAKGHPDRLDVLLGHTLLGDPALKIANDP